MMDLVAGRQCIALFLIEKGMYEWYHTHWYISVCAWGGGGGGGMGQLPSLFLHHCKRTICAVVSSTRTWKLD